jgi:hypothetical protein
VEDQKTTYILTGKEPGGTEIQAVNLDDAEEQATRILTSGGLLRVHVPWSRIRCPGCGSTTRLFNTHHSLKPKRING